MGRAKDIIIKPISSKDGNRITRQLHYSSKVVNNSQLHLGVFLDGRCGGVLQFGPSLDKRKIIGLVDGTKWNEFIELNRMALADWLPVNGESRAISVSLRLLKEHYPNLKWVVSFADATQCGDGAIYRASGFVLTAVKKNQGLYQMPNGEICKDITFADGAKGGGATKRRHGYREGEGAKRFIKRVGAITLKGFMIRYIYFLDKSYRKRLTVPELPYSAIKEAGASMYKGKKPKASEAGDDRDHRNSGGAEPTRTLQKENK